MNSIETKTLSKLKRSKNRTIITNLYVWSGTLEIVIVGTHRQDSVVTNLAIFDNSEVRLLSMLRRARVAISPQVMLSVPHNLAREEPQTINGSHCGSLWSTEIAITVIWSVLYARNLVPGLCAISAVNFGVKVLAHYSCGSSP